MIIAIIILLLIVIFLPILIANVDLGELLIEGLGPILESLEPLIPGCLLYTSPSPRDA